MQSPRKVKPVVSTHKNGTAPSQTDCCVISQERDPSLKNKLPCHLTRKGLLLKNNQNCRNQSQNASGSLEPCHNTRHGFAATRDSYRREFCITPSVVKQCFKRILKHFSYCPGDSTRFVQWVMIQDKPCRVLRSVVLDHSWTPFNQRLSDSRNCCRTGEEPPKLARKSFSALIQSFSQHHRATKCAHVEDVHCTPLRKGATILFLVFVTKTAIDHQDIDTKESDLILADVLSVKSL